MNHFHIGVKRNVIIISFETKTFGEQKSAVPNITHTAGSAPGKLLLDAALLGNSYAVRRSYKTRP